MLPYLTYDYGNPHSRTHEYGWLTEEKVEEARNKIAHLINAHPKEIFFTSGATESNNMAIKGVAGFYGKKKNHVITSQTEHKCVLDSCRYLEQEGLKVTYLPVQKNGIIDLDLLKNSITDETAMVSLMAVNNEIGVIQPLNEIGKICRERNVFFHTDAAQALGKIPIDVNESNIDLMSMSSHKIYGPKGIGALYVRRKPRVRLTPIMSGGGQERGLRSGTLPAPLCIGFGKACEVAEREMQRDHQHVKELSTRLINGLKSNLDQIIINGDLEQRYPGNINISFAFVEGESLIVSIGENVSISSGSACTSASLEPSYVLRALGVDEELAHTSLRFGIGRFTTVEEIDRVIHVVSTQVKRLRDLSPLYEMHMEGIDLSTINWAAH